MELGVVLAIQIFKLCSAASEITAQNENEPLANAAADIVNNCLGSAERWSEIMIITDSTSNKILEKIHQESESSFLIVSLVGINNQEFTRPEENENYMNASIELTESEPFAVIIDTYDMKRVESILGFLKNNLQRSWSPESQFFIILETQCNLDDRNNIFKIIWNYQILNAVVLCSSNNITDSNRSEIELYTFNPYSADHPSHWETIIHETVEVPMSSGNFNHSWYIFKQRFNDISFFGYCENLFFDKTLNLDGYTVPISVVYSKFLSDTMDSLEANLFSADSRALRTIAEKLRFNINQAFNHTPDDYGCLIENGTYTGMLNDLYNERSHLAPTLRGLLDYPGLGVTYPHDISGLCLASRRIGNLSQWINLAAAQDIWIAVALSLAVATVYFYTLNKHFGIVSAFLEAERLVGGKSINYVPKTIKQRILLGSMFLVILVLDGALRGRFVSFLTIAVPLPNIDTLEQVKNQDIDIYGHHVLVERTDSELKLRWHIIEDQAECLNSLIRNKLHRRVCLANCQLLPILKANLSDVYLSSTPVWSFPLTFFTAMHWPMKDRYSIVLHKLVESGIFKKWKQNAFMEFHGSSRNLESSTESPYVRPAKLNDLLSGFTILFIGMSLALIAFAWEMRTIIKCRSLES